MAAAHPQPHPAQPPTSPMPILHDITRPLHATTAPWPGDTAFDYRLTARIADGAVVNVGALTMGTHNGTHARRALSTTSSRRRADGRARSGALFVGPALVVDVSNGGLVHYASGIPREVAPAVLTHWHNSRLLLKTGACGRTVHVAFPSRIPTLASEVPAWLGSNAACACSASTCPRSNAIDSKTLPVHHALAAEDILIIESLDLSAVDAGQCTN